MSYDVIQNDVMRALAVSSLVPVPASGAEKETSARAETRDLPFGPFESSE